MIVKKISNKKRSPETGCVFLLILCDTVVMMKTVFL